MTKWLGIKPRIRKQWAELKLVAYFNSVHVLNDSVESWKLHIIFREEYWKLVVLWNRMKGEKLLTQGEKKGEKLLTGEKFQLERPQSRVIN